VVIGLRIMPAEPVSREVLRLDATLALDQEVRERHGRPL
jgi:hypothetical protein